jgi:hypothetical protein
MIFTYLIRTLLILSHLPSGLFRSYLHRKANNASSIPCVLHAPITSLSIVWSPSLTKRYAMKTYGGVGVQINSVLISTLAGGEWSASRPGRLVPSLSS